MNKESFRIFFNQNKQWLDVYVADDPAKFLRKNDCYAYYIGAEGRKQRKGLFGYIYLSVLDSSPLSMELMTHEVQHMIFDWVLCRKGATITEKNEEKIATLTGEIARRIWRKYLRYSER